MHVWSRCCHRGDNNLPYGKRENSAIRPLVSRYHCTGRGIFFFAFSWSRQFSSWGYRRHLLSPSVHSHLLANPIRRSTFPRGFRSGVRLAENQSRVRRAAPRRGDIFLCFRTSGPVNDTCDPPLVSTVVQHFYNCYYYAKCCNDAYG